MSTIETRKLSEQAIEHLIELMPKALENLYKHGDYLLFAGQSFTMVHYSLKSLEDGQSIDVTYWSELYDVQIDLDFIKNSVSVGQPCIDWKATGF